MDKQTKTGQMNRRNYTDFERNLAMMVIYVLSSLNLIGQTVFEFQSGNEKYGRTDKRMELHQFRKEPSYDGDLSPCQV